MISTGYESLKRHPGGDSFDSNGDLKSSGKAMHKGHTLPLGSRGSLKSSTSVKKDGSSSVKNSKNSLHAAERPGSSKSEVLFHTATLSSKPGVRKCSPSVEAVMHAAATPERIEMDRRVRQRPDQTNPYHLFHIDPHAENVAKRVPMHENSNQHGGTKSCTI